MNESDESDKFNPQVNSDKDGNTEKWGFDLYPERRAIYKQSWKDMFSMRGGVSGEKMKCENRVWKVVNKSPLIKLLINALEKSGCPIDFDRHISCEVCDKSLLGGYDQELNQIVVCQNVCTSDGRVQGALAHEMIHMFDYCKNKVDFTNIDHLACTEIKAANLTSCSFLTSMTIRRSNIFSVKGMHEDCVKSRAAMSVKYARNLTDWEAMEAVEKVFPKCYNDLEPIGRRPRRNSKAMHYAYRERHLYGYG